MSLTSELSISTSPIRQYIDSICDVRSISKRINNVLKSIETRRQPLYPHFYYSTLAGTATDLRFRAFFDPNIHRMGTVARGISVLSSISVERNGVIKTNPWHRDQYISRSLRQPLGNKLQESFDIFLASNNRQTVTLDDYQEKRMASFCLLFARIDHAVRGPNFDYIFNIADRDIETMLNTSAEFDLLDDIIYLADDFRRRHRDAIDRASIVFPGCILSGSADVWGADFDIVVDGTLWEFKTSIKPNIATAVLRQVVGYWLLDYDDEFAIENVAIDMSRQGHTERLNVLADLIMPTYSARGKKELRMSCKNVLRANKR